jgi:hypothetical protein
MAGFPFGYFLDRIEEGVGRLALPMQGHGNDSDTEGTFREELTREPFLAAAGVH